MSEVTGEGAGAPSGTREAGPGPAGEAAPGVPVASSPAPGRVAPPGWIAPLIRRHWLFGLALVGAAALRAVAMLGYPPIIWFHDSYSYLQTAVGHHLSSARPGGYPIFLALIEPLHSFVAVALLQHLMGLGTGVAIYAVLRRRGLPAWIATLAALPVLYDAYQVQLEQMVMSDALFMFVLALAITLLCWNDNVGPLAAGVAGLLIGYATVVRSVGLPLIILVALGLLARRVGWRPLAALVAGGILPIVAYMAVYHVQSGHFATTESDGIFLYGRVQSFADCAVMKPPASLRVLCDPRPPASRPVATEYIWAPNPLDKLAPHYGFFTPEDNHLAEQFAERAILAQPFSYLRVVARDTLRSFFWTRTLAYDGKTDIYYLFTDHPPVIASYRPWHDMRVYQPGLGQTRAVQPYASFLIGYQREVYLRGVLLGLILLLGLAGVAARWRRWGGLVLLPWLVAMMLLVLPVATSGFSYRYELAVVPFACLAGGLALSGWKLPGRRRSGGRPAQIRRKLGRGGPVDQD